MRVVTVRQPWAWAIVHGGKDVENRVRNVAGGYRGPVAIHVGLQDDDEVQDYDNPMHGLVFAPCPHQLRMDHNSYSCLWCTRIAPRRCADHGRIIGVVDLVDVHHDMSCPYVPGARGYRAGQCSVWAEFGAFHLVLENPRPLAEPIPYRGGLGLRRLPDDTATQIRAALAERTENA